ncbi:MAG TPA: lytic polysaccharide monooxygenase [Natronosporangium sp.]
MAAVAAATVMAIGTGIVVLVAAPSPASAHGAQVFPGSRQYLCWVDGLTESGQINPSNPACQTVLDQAGINPFYNWFANLDSNGAGQTSGYIPDGEICSGAGRGPFDFTPYDQARTDWPRTNITAGATYEFRHNNWAAHPGWFDVYVTRQGYNPNAPLQWSDLEKIGTNGQPISADQHTIQDPPQSGGPGGLEYYFWDQTLPSDRSGLHLIFVHWIRSDSLENFYSCSDVDFNGGNGEVIGIGGDPGPGTGEPPNPDEPPTTPGPPIVTSITSTGASVSWGAAGGFVTAYELVNLANGTEEVLAEITGNPPATSTALSGLTPDTQYNLAVRARNDNIGVVSELSDDAPFRTPAVDEPPPAGDCTVTYNITSQWNPGFQADVVITNESGAGINGWELEWSFANGQQITQLWGGVHSQTGANVSVRNESYNSSIGANGGSVSFGFLGNWSGANEEPTEFTLNGEACTVA